MSLGARVRTVATALAVALAALAAGCGEKSERGLGTSEQVDVALDFYVNPDHVGILQALDRGYFREAGLAVHTEVPSDPAAPIKQVAAGRADLAVSYEPEVLLAREEGLPVTAIGALVQEPLTSMISIGDERITRPRDLAGKRIATAGIPYQTAFLDAMLQEAGLSRDEVQQVDVGLNLLPAILSGRVDAILGGFKNVEGVDLQERGKDPTVVPVNELGIPTYDELVLVANSDSLDENRDTFRLFLAALERGTRNAASDPGGATDTLLRANPDLDPKLTAAEVKATLPLLLQRGGSQYAFMDARLWQEFAGFMTDEELIGAPPAIDDVITNELLPSSPSD
jgi:putative hydroxymethylpyrimidine transport system substrate-binding protein